jgi:hypothetical protein
MRVRALGRWVVVFFLFVFHCVARGRRGVEWQDGVEYHGGEGCRCRGMRGKCYIGRGNKVSKMVKHSNGKGK